ncbi:MAG: hypothetical protein A2Y12_03525 [Planctomycetes bacterium GWF2_42_9]|nr:MAG: hypothetical protein A2Y12_03525 [Planctomycetes bacterium GWF2_42_9]
MKIDTSNLPWSISEKLTDILQEAVKDRTGGCTVVFHDPKYSVEKGGFHPVEVMLDGQGQIQYITDFAFAGDEFCKEIDFDFSLGIFQHFGREFPIAAGRQLYQIWESNFTTYHRMGVFESTVEGL